jgi:hypothetical protein
LGLRSNPMNEPALDDDFAKTVRAEIDPGIAPYVDLLRKHGVRTTESCQGGEGHGYDLPTILFDGGETAGEHALAVARSYKLPVAELRRVWTFCESCEANGEHHGPFWELIFRSPETAPQP